MTAPPPIRAILEFARAISSPIGLRNERRVPAIPGPFFIGSSVLSQPADLRPNSVVRTFPGNACERTYSFAPVMSIAYVRLGGLAVITLQSAILSTTYTVIPKK